MQTDRSALDRLREDSGPGARAPRSRAATTPAGTSTTGARADLVGRLGLRRPHRGGPEPRRLHRPGHRRRVDLRRAGPWAASCAPSTTCAATGARSSWTTSRERAMSQGVRVPVPRLDVRPHRRLIGTPNVKEDEFFDRSAYPLHRITVDSYAGFLFVNLSGSPAADGGAHRRRGVHHRVRALQDGRAADRRPSRLRGRGELEDRRRELQRVPALPADPPRARAGRSVVPLRRGLGRGDPRRRQPHDRGRHELHDQRHVGAAEAPRSGSPRTTRCTTGATSSRT